MAFRKRRKPKVEWISGNFDALGAGTATGAGVARNFDLVSPLSASFGTFSSGGLLYIRRIVGICAMANTTAATAGSFSYGAYVVPVTTGSVTQSYSLTDENDFEDVRWLVRRDWSSCGHSATDVGPMMAGGVWYVDWKGIAKIEEGRTGLRFSCIGSVAYQSFIRLRVLLQAASA